MPSSPINPALYIERRVVLPLDSVRISYQVALQVFRALALVSLASAIYFTAVPLAISLTSTLLSSVIAAGAYLKSRALSEEAPLEEPPLQIIDDKNSILEREKAASLDLNAERAPIAEKQDPIEEPPLQIIDDENSILEREKAAQTELEKTIQEARSVLEQTLEGQAALQKETEKHRKNCKDIKQKLKNFLLKPQIDCLLLTRLNKAIKSTNIRYAMIPITTVERDTTYLEEEIERQTTEAKRDFEISRATSKEKIDSLESEIQSLNTVLSRSQNREGELGETFRELSKKIQLKLGELKKTLASTKRKQTEISFPNSLEKLGVPKLCALLKEKKDLLTKYQAQQKQENSLLQQLLKKKEALLQRHKLLLEIGKDWNDPYRIAIEPIDLPISVKKERLKEALAEEREVYAESLVRLAKRYPRSIAASTETP